MRVHGFVPGIVRMRRQSEVASKTAIKYPWQRGSWLPRVVMVVHAAIVHVLNTEVSPNSPTSTKIPEDPTRQTRNLATTNRTQEALQLQSDLAPNPEINLETQRRLGFRDVDNGISIWLYTILNFNPKP